MLRTCAKLRLLCNRKGAYRSLSAVVPKTFNVQQGGTLIIDLLKSRHANVEITSAWQDHCEVEYDSKMTDNSSFALSEDLDAQTLTIVAMSETSDVIKIQIPELFDVSIHAEHLNLSVKNKVLGDFSVTSSGGTVTVDKLRGTHLIFNCPSSDINVKKLLEGNSTVDCNILTAKMINGDNVHLRAFDKISVEAMYSKESVLETVEGNIHLGLMQGITEMRSEKGNITLKGVDGYFDVTSLAGDIDIQLNKLSAGGGNGKTSSAMATLGSVYTTVDPELVADIYLQSYVKNSDAIKILSDAFEISKNSMNSSIIEGSLTGKSKELKRPIKSRGGGQTSGKIDQRGAELQSLNSVDGSVVNALPSLKVIAGNQVTLETLSWIEAIRRKHFKDDILGENIGSKHSPLFDTKLSPNTVGRTAAAYQRMQNVKDESNISSDEPTNLAHERIYGRTPKSIKNEIPHIESSIVSDKLVPEDDIKVSVSYDDIPGMTTEGEKYILMFTCSICNTRSARKISKKGYHNGVVICRCNDCKNLHLIADRMGVFEDESWDIQNENVSITNEENVLEVLSIEKAEVNTKE